MGKGPRRRVIALAPKRSIQSARRKRNIRQVIRDQILFTRDQSFIMCDRILMTHELFYLSRDQILMTHEVLKLSSDRILMRSQHKRLVYEMHSEKGKPPPCSLEAERGHSWQTVCGRTHRPTLRSCLEFISEDIHRIFPGILFHLLRSIASYVTKKMGQKGGNRPG